MSPGGKLVLEEGHALIATEGNKRRLRFFLCGGRFPVRRFDPARPPPSRDESSLQGLSLLPGYRCVNGRGKLCLTSVTHNFFFEKGRPATGAIINL